MGCKAQLLPDVPVTVSVSPSAQCCNNIITSVPNFSINMVNVDNTILRGRVVCGPTNVTAVPGAVVVASFTDQAGLKHYFVGVTNANGEYVICVKTPASDAGNITYNIEAYRCCCADNNTPANCDCPSSGA